MTPGTPADQIDELLTRGVADIAVGASLRARLLSGRPLRLKQGFDPTRPDMHLGHAVGLRKLRAFQRLGHQVVLIVGDWTATIGDPSGRDASRPRLTHAEVRANAEVFMQQFFSVVDRAHTEVRWQSEWYGDFGLARALDLAGRFTLGQLLRHETFRRRYEAGAPLTMLELLYPILQGYDSVAVEADVELGGTDQRFNMLAGRELMAQLGMAPQDVLMVPLIPGLDGRKMSKSFGNTIDVRAAPLEMYSRTMAMRDEAVPLLVETLTDLPPGGDMGGALARKHRLAREVVAQIHGEGAAAQAAEAWARQFSRREEPEEMPEHSIDAPATVVDLLVASGLAASRSEARRLIDGGGVRLDGERVEGYGATVGPGRPAVLQVGRRRFVRVVGAGGAGLV